jgi:lysozyme
MSFQYNYESDQTTRSLIEKFEGIKLTAYKCPSGIPTIGMGSTRYEDGTRVRIGDEISRNRMNELYNFHINQTRRQLEKLVKTELNQNQKSALISLLYNVGYGNFKKSKLLRMINTNPNDYRIEKEFMHFTKSRGRVLKGLERRRTEELKLYFTKN